MGNQVTGVEISELAASEARKILDKVYVFNIEKSWPEEITREKFDLVILSEILEHVFDPIEVLKEVKKVLKSDGRIVITTPNFLTWTNRIRFLFGDLRYTEQGMFDFGHIRWFTYRYLKEVLESAGLRIGRENHIVFPGKLTKILRHYPSLFAWQFILEAKNI